MTRLLACLLLATAAHAAKPKKSTAPVAPPAAVAPASPPPAISPAPDLPTSQLLANARAALQALEFAQVRVLADAVVHRADASRAMQVEGFWLYGQAIAVLSDAVEAEPSFRTLLRLDPAFEPAVDPGPKILAVFRKVQLEERRIADELARRAREELVAGLSLTGAGPASVRGGRPASFSYRLKDPTGAVEEVKVNYRIKGSATPFSALALERTDDGHYTGAVPGELTANDGGARLEYFVEAVDAKGRLTGRADASAPLTVELTAGRVGRALPRRWLYGTFAATLVSAAAMLGLGAGAMVADASHASLVRSSMMPPYLSVPVQEWYGSKETASRLIISALVGLGATTLLGIATAIISRYVESAD